MPNRTEVHSANKAQLTEWLDELYEAPDKGWESLNVDQMKKMVLEALEDPELEAILNPPEDKDGSVPIPQSDDEEEAEEEAEPVDLIRPNPKTDLYTGQFRG